MTRLKYEFTLNKIAIFQTSRGSIPIGLVEEYFDNNGQVRLTIKLSDQLPPEFIENISEHPEFIGIVGQPSDLKNIQLVTQPIIHLSN